jgi:cation diffusion facilitator CzcD-associated flavoprotein CzcO
LTLVQQDPKLVQMAARNDHILIIGAGFAGIAMALALLREGIHDFTIVEKADEVGGTWRENHYPGLQCDVESHLYSLSAAPNPDWSRTYAPQREILAYLKRVTDDFDLRRRIRFGTEIVGATFDDRTGLWDVRVKNGEPIRARVVVSGTGPLHKPAFPDIPGLATFAGKVFHSARWDDAYPLAGKTVAVVGTGASAIQIIPSIQPQVGKLHVFQRTPAWVLPRPDREYTAGRKALNRRFPLVQWLARAGIYWRRELFATGFVVEPRILKLLEGLARRYLASQVPDAALRAKLTPGYRMGCKRVLISNDYYASLGRENVELVTDAITEVRAHSVVTADGRERAVDALVLATGFHAADQVAPFDVRGRGGRVLDEVWKDGAEGYLGTAVSGFPNLFLMVGPNTGLGHSSMVFIIESQVAYALDAIETMRARRLKLVDLRADVQARYNDEMQRRLAKTVWSSGCKSWYQTPSGKNVTLWPGYTFEFRLRTRKFDVDAYELVVDEAAKPVAVAHANAPVGLTN